MSEKTPPPKNIFEAASTIEKARSQKKTSFLEGQYSRTSRAEQAPLKKRQETTEDDLFYKGKKIHEEISSKVDSVFSTNKISPSDYRKYLSRPQNFSSKEWQELEEQKRKNEVLLKDLVEKAEKKLLSVFSEAKIEPEKTLEKTPEKPLEIKPPVKKAKIITRRQWIGM